MKNKAADLSRIGLNLIRISICVRVWKFGTWINEEWIQIDDQTYMCV
jgi:hypothetical protein